MSDQETIGIRLGDQYVPTSAYVNRALPALEERLERRIVKGLEEIAERVVSLEERVDRRSANGDGYKAVPEEKWQLIEQVLEKVIDWHIAYTQKPAHVYQDRSLVILGDLKRAVDAYRKQADQ